MRARGVFTTMPEPPSPTQHATAPEIQP
jgi:hypothetical protein